jgi:hypothetical protein
MTSEDSSGIVSRRKFVAGTLAGTAAAAAALPASAQAATVDVDNPSQNQVPVWNGSSWQGGNFPDLADYQVVVSGDGVGLINTRTGNTDFSTSSGDHAPVVQAAVNALHQANNGGLISFISPGPAKFLSQLTIYPGIFLEGRGPLAAQLSGGRPAIHSLYNGSCIVITGDGSTIAYCGMRDMAIFGDNSLSAQNGIEWNNSGGGNIQDTFLERITLFNMGLDGYYLNGVQEKVWMTQCYCELAGRHGINQNSSSSSLYLVEGYILQNSGNGYLGNAASLLAVSNSSISNNHGVGLALAPAGIAIVGTCQILGNRAQGVTLASSGEHVLVGNNLSANGGPTVPDVDMGASSGFIIANNMFFDGRGANAVTNQIRLGSVVKGVIQGNYFSGHQGPAISLKTGKFNDLQIYGNIGFNDSLGSIATPFSGTRIGFAGNTAVPAASTDYKAEGTNLYVAVSGGTGVSITITDPGGNTVQSNLTSFMGLLPVQYSINFGPFTTAPTVYVGVT